MQGTQASGVDKAAGRERVLKAGDRSLEVFPPEQLCDGFELP
jgi:hypothetical protein